MQAGQWRLPGTRRHGELLTTALTEQKKRKEKEKTLDETTKAHGVGLVSSEAVTSVILYKSWKAQTNDGQMKADDATLKPWQRHVDRLWVGFSLDFYS